MRQLLGMLNTPLAALVAAVIVAIDAFLFFGYYPLGRPPLRHLPHHLRKTERMTTLQRTHPTTTAAERTRPKTTLLGGTITPTATPTATTPP